MITIQNIIEFSKEHPSLKNGRITRIGNSNVEFSIVGGTLGLYPDALDDVIPYMPKEDLETLINKVLRSNDFQVR